jgi:hypothetical protein
LSGPQPPYPFEYISKTSVQKGGPVSVATGSYTFAITFGSAFPDTAYQIAFEWLSGGTFEYAGAPLTLSKTVNYAVIGAPGGGRVTRDSTLNWRAWRLP